MKQYRLVITGLGKWFNDKILFESNDLESIKQWIKETFSDDENITSDLYDLVYDLESFNLYLESTLSWENLVTGVYKIKTIDDRKYDY